MVSEMRESEMYATTADEAGDGITEQLALCIIHGTIPSTVRERFLCLTEMGELDAASITAGMKNQLVEFGIDHLKCVAHILTTEQQS